jgi:hypothetical protein
MEHPVKMKETKDTVAAKMAGCGVYSKLLVLFYHEFCSRGEANKKTEGDYCTIVIKCPSIFAVFRQAWVLLNRMIMGECGEKINEKNHCVKQKSNT